MTRSHKQVHIACTTIGQRVKSSYTVSGTNTTAIMAQSPEKITRAARGGFNPHVITQTNSLNKSIISHLSEKEQPQFVFYHQYKGFRIFCPDGREETPDHENPSWGKRFLVISDQRIIYLVGKEDGDKVKIFDYDDLAEVDANQGWTHGRINITTKDGIEYKFADTGGQAEDIEDAGEYVRKQIERAGNDHESQQSSDNDHSRKDSGDDVFGLTEGQTSPSDATASQISNTAKTPSEVGTTGQRDPSKIESVAEGDVNGEELTSTGGKLFKVGYFESPVASRLDDSETVEYVLRNFTDGMEHFGEEYKPADNRRAVACITDRRLLFVVGGQYSESDGSNKDRVISIPLERLLQATREEDTLIITSISDHEGVATSRFPVKNTDSLPDAISYLSTRRNESVLEQRVRKIENAMDTAKIAFENEEFSDAIDAAEQAIEVYDRYEAITGELQGKSQNDDNQTTSPVQTDEIPVPEDSKQDIVELLDSIRSSKWEQTYESHLQRAKELQNQVNNKDPLNVDLSAYNTAKEELEEARKVATEHEVGSLDEIREQINHINQRRYEIRQEKIDKLQERAKESRESGDISEAIETYSEVLNELTKLREFARDHDMPGNSDAIFNQIRDVEKEKDNLQIISLGQRVSNISVPDPSNTSVESKDIKKKIKSLNALVEEIDHVETDRENDLALIREEAISKLTLCKFRQQKSRALIASEHYQNSEYSESRKLFEEAAEQLRSLRDNVTDENFEEEISDIDRLAEICENNADIARKTALGLSDDSELQTIEPEITENEATDETDLPENISQVSDSTGSSQIVSSSEVNHLDANLSYEDIDKQELIGSGGNADVFHATATINGTEYDIALKEPRMEGTIHAEAVERFTSEAETWSQLDNHDHIVSVLSHGSSPIPWIALEYMEDGDMNVQRPQLNLSEKFRVAIQITDAVWSAHQRGVAHLDLKPENILFTPSNNGSAQQTIPKVADWGLAKMLLNHSKSVEGLSPQYSAPEQFDSDTYGNPDNQTDIYQMGMILYELFTDHHPFQGPPSQVMHSVLNDMPDSPSTYASNLPDGLDSVLLTALAKEKADRFEAMVYFRDMLQKTAPFQSA